MASQFSQPNYQTVSGVNVYKAPPKPGSLVNAMGAKAKAPEQNVVKPASTISASQTAPRVNTPNPTNSTNGVANPNQDPIAKASLSAPQGTPNQQPPQNNGLYGQLMQQSTYQAPQGSGLYGQLTAGLANTAANNPATNGPALGAYNQSVQDLQNLKSGIAKQYGAIESQPIPLEFQQGREQALARQYASQLDAGQQAVNQQQAALGYQIQGQQTQQSGLQNAGAMAVPILGQYGQANYNPNNPNGSSLAPGTPMYQSLQQYAQGLQQGTVPYNSIPSTITGNPILNSQLLQMAGQGGGFNLNQSLGSSAAQQSVANIAGVAPAQANQSIYGNALNTYYQLQNSVQNVDQFGGLLTQTMQQGGINPFDVKYANKSLSEVRGQLSSEQQAVYDNTLASLRSRVSGLLAAGGSEIPTAITADAQKILDGTLPLSALTSVLGRIQQEGQILLQNQAGMVNQARQGTLGGQAGGGTITWDSL